MIHSEARLTPVSLSPTQLSLRRFLKNRRALIALAVLILMGLLTHEEATQATEVARRNSGAQRIVKLFEYLD